jgi:hypothetical protein
MSIVPREEVVVVEVSEEILEFDSKDAKKVEEGDGPGEGGALLGRPGKPKEDVCFKDGLTSSPDFLRRIGIVGRSVAAAALWNWGFGCARCCCCCWSVEVKVGKTTVLFERSK